MPLPEAWVTSIFARLAVRYGVAFQRQYPADADTAVIKADWADVLDGISGDAITYALRYLPEQPVNAIRFRAICAAAPASQALALPAPPANPAAARAVKTVIRDAIAKGAADPRTPVERTIDHILDCATTGNGMSGAQRGFCRVCVRMLLHDDPRRDRLASFGVVEERSIKSESVEIGGGE